MKDQRVLFRKSQLNDIPAIIFQGKDPCAVEILKSAAEIYMKNGCNVEFLFDFERLTRDFEIYSKEYRDSLVMPSTGYLADKHLLNECIYQDIPVIVFQGTDICAVEILKSAEEIYKRNGCDQAFLSDFQSSIKAFEEYELKNISVIKIPQLSASEKDFVREDMEYNFLSAVDRKDAVYLQHLGKLGYEPSDEIMLKAIEKDPLVIEYFNHLSERVQLAAVQYSAYAIQGICNPTEKVVVSAMRKCPGVFELIYKPSEKAKIAAVKINPSCLQFISEPSKEVVLSAAIVDAEEVKLCMNVPESMIKEVVEPYLAFKSAVENSDFKKFIELREQGYCPPKEVIQSLSSSFSGSTSVAIEKIFGIEMTTIPEVQLVLDLPINGQNQHLVNNVVEQSL